MSFCSRDAHKAADYQRRFGGRAAYDDLSVALNAPGIESCVICVPHHRHEEYVAAAVRHGKHILLEKPLAHTIDSAERIVQLTTAEGHGRTAMLAEQMDHLPVIANLRRFAATATAPRYIFRELNRFQPTGWRTRLDESGGGVMLDLGIHYVSLAVQVFGPIATHRKDVRTTAPGTGVPLAERLILRHTSGAEGGVDVAWAHSQDTAHIEVVTPTSTFRYVPGRRLAMAGRLPQFVCLRSANGRLQMTQAYVHRCRDAAPTNNLAAALPLLASVL